MAIDIGLPYLAMKMCGSLVLFLLLTKRKPLTIMFWLFMIHCLDFVMVSENKEKNMTTTKTKWLGKDGGGVQLIQDTSLPGEVNQCLEWYMIPTEEKKMSKNAFLRYYCFCTTVGLFWDTGKILSISKETFT